MAAEGNQRRTFFYPAWWEMKLNCLRLMGKDTLFRIFNEDVPFVLDDELDSVFEKFIFGIVAEKAYWKVTLQNLRHKYLKTQS